MKKALRVFSVFMFVLFCISIVTSPALGDCCGGSGGSGPSNVPPTQVIFSGEITQKVPCTFVITLSSSDSDGTVKSFGYTGTLPEGYGLSGNVISGPTLTNNCGPEIYISSWVAVDDDNASSSPASNLTLTCHERSNQPPDAPEYTGGTLKTAPCSFAITLHSNDPDGRIRKYELVGGSLPPGYELEGNAISGGLVDPGQWTATFRAHDNDCEPGPSSTLTLECMDDMLELEN